jgi:hypothetical protein
MGPRHGLRGVVIPGEELLPGRVLGAERPRQAKVQVQRREGKQGVIHRHTLYLRDSFSEAQQQRNE